MHNKICNNINDLISLCETFSPVSHETSERLKIYTDILVKWQAKINLVSPSTIPELWHRHIYDSAQLMKYVSCENNVVDIGSGAGFPGLILAMFGTRVRLIESDQRKCAFMNEVALRAGITIDIQNKRIGECGAVKADFITARALAPLLNLINFSQSYMALGAKALFLKGSGLEEELTLAKQMWHIDYQVDQSLSDPSGSVILIHEAKRV